MNATPSGQRRESRVAVITGAASGIGAAVLETWHQSGGHSVAADIRPIPQSGTSRSSHCLQADVTLASDCAMIIDSALAQFGRLDVLFNVAGICPYPNGIEDVGEDVWDSVMSVNVKAVYLMARAAVPALRASPGAVIVNVASVHAFAGMPRSAAYAASKGAVVALTRQMAVDLAPYEIRVVALAPGAVNTTSSREGAAALGTTLDQLGFSSDPRQLGHLAAPEEVAKTLVWLSDPLATLLNGATVLADNGLLAQFPQDTAR